MAWTPYKKIELLLERELNEDEKRRVRMEYHYGIVDPFVVIDKLKLK